MTDTRAQETSGRLPGNPSQSAVADELEAAGITVHVIGHLGRAGDYTVITNQTGGSYSNIFPDQAGETVTDAMNQALTSIENEIEGQLDAVSEYVFQTGVDSTLDDRVVSDVALDATKLGLEIDSLTVGTREDAVLALDDLSVAFDNLNQAMTTYASLENKLDRLSENTATMIQSETQSLATIKDADFAESSTEYAMAKVRNENSMNVLRLWRRDEDVSCQQSSRRHEPQCSGRSLCRSGLTPAQFNLCGHKRLQNSDKDSIIFPGPRGQTPNMTC